MLRSTTSLVRFVAAVPKLLRSPITLDEARREIRENLARREERFLTVAERLIYGYPRSPYRPLLELAGCELGDLRESVRRKGLESTLGQLRDEGVHVSFAEFKGRQELVRGGRLIKVDATDFENPLGRAVIRATTGGSTGAPRSTPFNITAIADRRAARLVGLWAHGLLGVPLATWRERLPSPNGLIGLLSEASVGNVGERWFAPRSPFDLPASAAYRIATEMVIAAARRAGVSLPRPELVDYDRPDVVARWAHRRAREHGASCVRTGLSKAVRVAEAARDLGLDLTGVAFSGTGEPATPAKTRVIKDTGARHVGGYRSSEVGNIGTACAQPVSSSDVHFFADAQAMIVQPLVLPDGTEVGCFMFTSLTTHGRLVLLNVDSDDYGVVEERACGCPLGELGLPIHIRDIYSVTKLTGEGLTLLGADLLHVLEHVLPARFGGSPLDYQLHEGEDERGLTRVTIVVDPKVTLTDESALIEAVMTALGSDNLAREARHVWKRSDTVRVRRETPRRSVGGKHLPLVKLGRMQEETT